MNGDGVDRFNILKNNESMKKDQISSISNFKNPTINEARRYIRDKLNKQMSLGMKNIIIKSGDIHKELKMDNAMPTVCSVMRSLGEKYKYEVI